MIETERPLIPTRRREIARQTKKIRRLRNRGCLCEVLQAKHETIELMLRWFHRAILSAAGHTEVIEILDASIEFCATLFSDEEKFMWQAGQDDETVHAMMHRHLLAKFVDARWCASGEGLSLAVLDAVDALHELKDHVNAYDQSEVVVPKRQELMGAA
jgi:hemerythrin